MRFSIPFHKFLEENHHRQFPVAALGNKGFQNFSFMINGPPQVMCFSIYLHENFVQMPSPVGVITGRRMKSFLPDLIGKQWAGAVRLMRPRLYLTQFANKAPQLCHAKLLPLGQRSISLKLECFSVV